MFHIRCRPVWVLAVVAVVATNVNSGLLPFLSLLLLLRWSFLFVQFITSCGSFLFARAVRCLAQGCRSTSASRPSAFPYPLLTLSAPIFKTPRGSDFLVGVSIVNVALRVATFCCKGSRGTSLSVSALRLLLRLLFRCWYKL